MPKRIVVPALIAALLAVAVSPVPSQAGNLAGRVASALKLAKQADKRSRLALKRTMPIAAQGTAGRDGARGIDGQSITGAAGVNGDTGATGNDGAPGKGLAPVTARNEQAVFLDTAGTTVQRVTATLDTAGPLLIVADLQMTADVAEAAVCELRVDDRVADDRYEPLPAGVPRNLSFHTIADVTTGQHEAALVCRKSTVAASVEVPFQRSRLSVVGGA